MQRRGKNYCIVRYFRISKYISKGGIFFGIFFVPINRNRISISKSCDHREISAFHRETGDNFSPLSPAAHNHNGVKYQRIGPTNKYGILSTPITWNNYPTGNSGTIDRCQLLTRRPHLDASAYRAWLVAQLSTPFSSVRVSTETSLKRQFYDVQNFLTRSTHHCCRAIVIDVYSTMNRNTVLHLSLYFDKSVRHDMKLFIDSLKMYNYIVIKFWRRKKEKRWKGPSETSLFAAV